MQLRPHDNRDGMKVWLNEEEVDQLIDQPDEKQRQLAFALAARCGLRSQEILEVCPDDLVDNGDTGHYLTVVGKGDKYRETPVNRNLATRIETIDEYRPEDSSQPLIDVSTTQSLRLWIKDAREKLADKTDNDRWEHLSMHDLRRTWADSLSAKDVDALVVLDWGGWSDIETFLDHYRGTQTPEAQRRERAKVDWL